MVFTDEMIKAVQEFSNHLPPNKRRRYRAYKTKSEHIVHLKDKDYTKNEEVYVMSEEQENLVIKEKCKQQRDILISNTVRVLGFILLAIAFNHWWIALFSILFLSCTKD